MFCPKCGFQCEDSELFCTSCGAPLNEDAPQDPTPASAPVTDGFAGAEAPTAVSDPAPAKKKLNPKYIGMGAVAAAALLIIVLIASLIGGGKGSGGSSLSDKAISLYYSNASDKYVLLAGGKVVEEISADNASITRYTADQAMALATIDEELYLLSHKGAKKIAGEYNGIISPFGDTVIYGDGEDFFLYNVSKGGKGQRMDFKDEESDTIAISPDGKTYAFAYEDDGDYRSYLSVNGKNLTEVGKNCYPVAVSNGGTYLYYVKTDDAYSSYGSLYVRKGKSDVKLTSDYYIYDNIALNRDGSEVLYQKDGKTYLSAKGKDGDKVFNSSLPTPNARYNYLNGYIFDVSSFRDQVYRTDSGLYYLNNKLESHKVVGNYSYRLSEDGNRAIYLQKGNLYLIENVKKDSDPKCLTDKLDDMGLSVSSFAANSACSAVFYKTDEGELYYQKGAGKPVKVIDDVDQFSVGKDGTCYILSDDQLYTSTGKKAAPVKSTGADDIDELLFLYPGMAYISDGDLYYAKSGGKFTLLIKDVSSY